MGFHPSQLGYSETGNSWTPQPSWQQSKTMFDIPQSHNFKIPFQGKIAMFDSFLGKDEVCKSFDKFSN